MNLESRIRHERLTQMCFIDYDRQMALVAERTNVPGRSGEIVGVGRLIKLSGNNQAEVAVLVSDACQNRGIGTELVRRLIEFAKDEKLELLTASFLAENESIAKLFKSHGFTISDGMDPDVQQAELRL
jgi:acetyltransferase